MIIQSHHKIKKTHGDNVHEHRKERKILQRSSRVHQRPRSASSQIQMKTKNLKNELATSSNLQTTVPVPPLYQGLAASSQGPAASSQGPAASANAGDEDSEYSDEYSAQSQDSGRTVLYSDLHVVIHCEHWAMTPETHKYAAAAGSFCFVTTGNGRQQDIYKFDHFAVPTTIIVP